MSEKKLPPKILSHYGFFSFTPAFYALSTAEKESFHTEWQPHWKSIRFPRPATPPT